MSYFWHPMSEFIKHECGLALIRLLNGNYTLFTDSQSRFHRSSGFITSPRAHHDARTLLGQFSGNSKAHALQTTGDYRYVPF